MAGTQVPGGWRDALDVALGGVMGRGVAWAALTAASLYVLAGCTVVDRFSGRAVEYNLQAEQAQEQALLLNIVRASMRRPSTGPLRARWAASRTSSNRLGTLWTQSSTVTRAMRSCSGFWCWETDHLSELPGIGKLLGRAVPYVLRCGRRRRGWLRVFAALSVLVEISIPLKLIWKIPPILSQSARWGR